MTWTLSSTSEDTSWEASALATKAGGGVASGNGEVAADRLDMTSLARLGLRTARGRSDVYISRKIFCKAILLRNFPMLRYMNLGIRYEVVIIAAAQCNVL